MNGKSQGLIILKNGGAIWNVGGNQISKMIELMPLQPNIRGSTLGRVGLYTHEEYYHNVVPVFFCH
jgi:hypothetical protein